MLDLYGRRYDRKTLKENIYSIKFIDVIKTQKLDVTFIVRYILNPKYQISDEDKLTIDNILFYQKHITREKLESEMINYSSDEDSIENFEVFSKRCN